MECIAKLSYEIRDDGVVLRSSIRQEGFASLQVEGCTARQNLLPIDVPWRLVTKWIPIVEDVV